MFKERIKAKNHLVGKFGFPRGDFCFHSYRKRDDKSIMRLSKNLSASCKRKKITVKELSKLSGVPAPTIHGWISGKKAQNLEQLKKVAVVLKEPLYELLFDEPDPYQKIDGVMLKELFSGDVRVTIHKIVRG